jgi:hypothetical protein
LEGTLRVEDLSSEDFQLTVVGDTMSSPESFVSSGILNMGIRFGNTLNFVDSSNGPIPSTGGEPLQKTIRLQLDINVIEEENGFKITFTRHTGALGGKRAEYIARSLEEFLTPTSLEAVKKLQ